NNLSLKLLQLKLLLPEIFSEQAIDFAKFQQLFGDHITTEPDRYMLNWAGKSAAYQTLQTPTFKTLTPCVAESVDFDRTQNVFIEGENLDVLKALQKSYFNSIKMIYIDPPYNTGNDFVYHDDFAQHKAEYAEQVGDIDETGKLKRAFVRNSKENGHYHSNWLNMMLPRLHLARNLLKEDGVIFISIDDNEQAQLKLLCDEVFGEENFVGEITLQSNPRGSQASKHLSNVHEFIFMYSKNKEELKLKGILKDEDNLQEYSEVDENGRKYRLLGLRQRGGAWKKEDRPKMHYPIYVNPNNGFVSLNKSSEFSIEVIPARPTGELSRWTWGKEKISANLDCVIGKKVNRTSENGEHWDIFRKDFIDNDDGSVKTAKIKTIWIEKETNYQNAKKEIFSLFNNSEIFDFPKPTYIIQRLASMLFVEQGDIILDFFAGSGTTAHAVMQLNAEDGGNRRFICVQLPEQVDEKSGAYKAGFSQIADISKERIRRAGSQVLQNFEQNRPLAAPPDVGFKVFKLTDSHFKQWQSPSVENLADQLEMFVDSLKTDTDPLAILYEILLRLGLKLTAQLRWENHICWVTNDNGQRFALLLTQADEGIFETALAEKPKKVVVLDSLFNGNDALKKNAELQLQDEGISLLVM
ncbi:site-specific DNA-methyltransferase, partial [Frederiksenia canicola]